MTWIEYVLTHMEARLRLLVEGDGESDGFPRKLQRVLEGELITAMKTATLKPSANAAENGLMVTAPDQYTLVLPSVEAQILLTHPTVLDRLTLKLKNTAVQAGIALADEPMLRVVADPQAMEISIVAEYSRPGKDDSRTYQMEETGDGTGNPVDMLPNAYLIVNGLSTYPLTQPVINIGRDVSNQLRLNDPQISLQHAQLRFIQGRFIIFDLDSHAGTLVNGVPVSSRALSPGDVIQLAGLPLVFGQDVAVQAGQTQELPAGPPPPEVL